MFVTAFHRSINYLKGDKSQNSYPECQRKGNLYPIILNFSADFKSDPFYPEYDVDLPMEEE